MSCWPPVAVRAQREPQRVGAVPVDHLDRIDHVAERLGHLPTVPVPDQPVDHRVAERHVADQEQARHDHARHPEVEDLVAGHENLVRVEDSSSGVSLRPPQRRVRPQLRAEPRVEDVGVLLERAGPARRARSRDPRRPPSRGRPGSTTPGCGGPTRAAGRCSSRAGCPASPRTAAATARARTVTRPSSAASFAGPGEAAHLHEPLQPRDPWLDLAVASVAVPDRVQVRTLLLDQQTEAPQGVAHGDRAPRTGRGRGTPRTASLSVASASRMFISGRPVRCAMSKSFGSCAGVTFTAPVPNVRST